MGCGDGSVGNGLDRAPRATLSRRHCERSEATQGRSAPPGLLRCARNDEMFRLDRRGFSMTTRRNVMVGLAAGPVLATNRSFAQQGEIKIGEVNSYSGLPAFTEPYRKGLQLAVEEINAK